MQFLYIILAIFIFGVLIFIHELGHFIAARLCGVKILEFAIGMGPKLLGWKSKKSGTQYALRLFPIGGFVSMLGENGMEAVQGENGENEEHEEVSLINEIEETSDLKETEEDSSEASTVASSLDKSAYCNQSAWKRILISVAGPAMNILLGFFLMISIVLMAGIENAGTNRIWGFYVTYTEEESLSGIEKDDYIVGYVEGDRRIPITSLSHFTDLVEQSETHSFDLVINRLSEDGSEIKELILEDTPLFTKDLSGFQSSLSEASGLREGDEVIKVNSTSTYIANDLHYELMMQGYRPMTLTVLRDGEEIVLEDVVIPNESQDGTVIGLVDFIVVREAALDFPTVMKHTWCRSISTVKTVFDSLFGLFSGRFGVEAISGPVGITKTIGEVAQNYGFVNLLYLVVVISINLGVMNLLPLPALDGGHILIYLIELIRRKPLKREVEAMINFIGIVVLLGLAIIIAFKDVFTLL
ncbi:MAG: RIP metalloprotease RseP [Ruminococcaceae bacterium]|nr:RIP metalloprotease RseP [Oscillospiraceae bacterium]